MSRSLVGFMDIALIPAAIMVVAKCIGLLITLALFEIPWEIRQIPESLLSTRPGVLPEDIITASSYSDLFMYVLVAVGFSFILMQATHFHDTHISPQMLVRLANNNLLGLVRSSFSIYHTAAIWLIVLWIATILILVNVAAQNTYLWIGVVALIATSIFTSLLLQDAYKEIEIGKKSTGNFEALA